jgi:mxaK protein
MVLSTRRRTRAVLVVLAVVAVAAAVDASRWWTQSRWNDEIASGAPGATERKQPPQVQFAQAHAQAASGAREAALTRYRALQADPVLADAARYNSANLLMRQAIEVRATSQPGQAVPLLELAKESYRELLRHDPDNWPARYNLERAQRLLPDPEDPDEAPVDVKRDAERAVTTMRGYSPGMP